MDGTNHGRLMEVSWDGRVGYWADGIKDFLARSRNSVGFAEMGCFLEIGTTNHSEMGQEAGVVIFS